jgi:hypothetical protein
MLPQSLKSWAEGLAAIQDRDLRREFYHIQDMFAQTIKHDVCTKGGIFYYDDLPANEEIHVMTLSKGVSSLGLQVQSVVTRVNFPHEGTRGLISNSRGTDEKALVTLLQTTCKTTSLSCVPNSTKWLSSTRCKCK